MPFFFVPLVLPPFIVKSFSHVLRSAVPNPERGQGIRIIKGVHHRAAGGNHWWKTLGETINGKEVAWTVPLTVLLFGGLLIHKWHQSLRRDLASLGASVKAAQSDSDQRLQALAVEREVTPHDATLTFPSLISLTEDELLALRKWIGHGQSIKLLYRGSRDGFTVTDMLRRVGSASPLLLLIRQDCHLFGCYMEAAIKQPPRTNRCTGQYRCHLWFFALRGAFDTPIKIAVPPERRLINVAGDHASIKSDLSDCRGKLCLGRGYLWLGWGLPGPTNDVRSMHQYIGGEHLPESYRGEVNRRGCGTLASTMNGNAIEVEVWQVLSSTAAERREGVRQTGEGEGGGGRQSVVCHDGSYVCDPCF